MCIPVDVSQAVVWPWLLDFPPGLQRVLNMHGSVVPVVCVALARDFLAVTQSSRNQTFVCLIAVLYKYC